MAQDPKPDPNSDLLISYITLRRLVGILGIALPIILLFGNMINTQTLHPQKSISHNYHTIFGDFFVGTLCAICLFLFVYKGRKRIDGILCNVAGILGSLVALISCEYDEHSTGAIKRGIGQFEDQGLVHNIIAGVFLLTLAYISIVIFTRFDDKEVYPANTKKPKRNKLYRVCGWVIVVCVIACAVVMFIANRESEHPSPPWIYTKTPVFYLEAIALWAFGLSWLVKGETLWRDKP